MAYLSSEIRRIALDVKDILKHPIEGIKYIPDDTNIMKGYALIIGPEETPYAHGNFFFKVEFGSEYPFKPPHVTYMTNDGKTRFNPNFYRNGKVCLSILNTWEGDQWSSCQSLRSVLITLQMTFNEYPLVNEPGICKKNHKDYIDIYNQIIRFKTIQVSILEYINRKNKPEEFIPFNDYVIETFRKNKQNILDELEGIVTTNKSENRSNNVEYDFKFYSMKGNLDYELLHQKIFSLNV